jgi:hypothetical protein
MQLTLTLEAVHMTPADLPGVLVPRTLVSPWLVFVEPAKPAAAPQADHAKLPKAA